MNSIDENEFKYLEFWEPEMWLTKWFVVKTMSESPRWPKQVRHWVARPLRKYKEQEQAAWFCYCVKACCPPENLYEFAVREKSDYDCVVRSKAPDGQFVYLRVQLKELVNAEVNPNAQLQDIVNGLRKYVDSQDLTVAIYLNRAVVIDLGKIKIPRLKIRQLWYYAELGITGIVPCNESCRVHWGDFFKA